jgi:hypothetical protein
MFVVSGPTPVGGQYPLGQVDAGGDTSDMGASTMEELEEDAQRLRDKKQVR